MKTFRTLELAIEFYGLVEEMKLQGHLRDQLFRAATSISLNLSEGNAKRTINEKMDFQSVKIRNSHTGILAEAVQSFWGRAK